MSLALTHESVLKHLEKHKQLLESDQLSDSYSYDFDEIEDDFGKESEELNNQNFKNQNLKELFNSDFKDNFDLNEWDECQENRPSNRRTNLQTIKNLQAIKNIQENQVHLEFSNPQVEILSDDSFFEED